MNDFFSINPFFSDSDLILQYLNIVTLFIAFSLYCLIKMLYSLSKKFFHPEIKFNKSFAISAVYINGLFLIAVLLEILLIRFVDYSPSVDEVYQSSIYLLELDKRIFGDYPVFWVHSIDNPAKIFFDYITVLVGFVYKYIEIHILLISICSLFYSRKIFYQVVVSLFFVCYLSVPIWYLIPAISPHEAFFQNILNKELPEHILQNISRVSLNVKTTDMLLYLDNYWNSNVDGYFAVTTFPSMHAAWVFVLLYFSRRLSKVLFIYFISFILLTIVATVYFLQHYLIDIFLGLAIGYLVCNLAERFLKNSPTFAKPVEDEIISDIKYIDSKIKNLKLS